MTWKGERLKLDKSASKAKPITPEQLASSGTEDGHQAAVFCWAALNFEKYPQLKNLHSIPNGGQRHIAEAIKFVATGTRAGVPDTFLAWPIWVGEYDPKPYAGLYIENKVPGRQTHKNGGCSAEQLDWLERLTAAGYCCRVCYGWEDARATIIAYLEGKL